MSFFQRNPYRKEMPGVCAPGGSLQTGRSGFIHGEAQNRFLSVSLKPYYGCLLRDHNAGRRKFQIHAFLEHVSPYRYHATNMMAWRSDRSALARPSPGRLFNSTIILLDLPRHGMYFYTVGRCHCKCDIWSLDLQLIPRSIDRSGEHNLRKG